MDSCHTRVIIGRRKGKERGNGGDKMRHRKHDIEIERKKLER